MAFLETKYLYLFLLVFTISYPLAQSFEKRIQLYRNIKSILFGILTVVVVFVPWDIWFTEKAVWWFNDTYVTGLNIFNLPIEEVMFFICIPYALIFIYEVLNFFIKKDVFGQLSKKISWILGIGFLLISINYYNQLYTSVTFVFCGVLLIFAAVKHPKWLGRFYLAYLVSLLPFILINGILTGSLIESPVVNYNTNQIIGIRVFTIPIEDAVYNLLMFLLTISVYENTKKVYQLKS